MGHMNICENFEKTIGTMTLEGSIYEDGYVVVDLLDQFGHEVATMDGTAEDGNTAELRAHIENALIDEHYNE
ncbi:hypothetical protein SEA_DEJAVU_83 [Microbacterium Phage DejaVu]|nr:hypothetical protein SEA_DEJAVU_83 [Microbacterium Phage DejaVu]